MIPQQFRAFGIRRNVADRFEGVESPLPELGLSTGSRRRRCFWVLAKEEAGYLLP